MDLNLGLRRSFTHVFIVADVNSAILGTDFLQAFGLVDRPVSKGSRHTTCNMWCGEGWYVVMPTSGTYKPG